MKKYGLKVFLQKILIKISWFFKAYDTRYNRWFHENVLCEAELELQRSFPFCTRPLISIVVPAYNTPHAYLVELIHSVLSQTYSNWELCIADGNSTDPLVRETLLAFAAQDSRIRPILLETNSGVSANTNEAIAASHGEIIVFSDHDDLLSPDALFEIVNTFLNTDADYVYSDEDKVDERSAFFFTPNLKPTFSPEYLCCTNYICHLSAIKKEKLLQIGFLDPRYDGSQDHDLALRAMEHHLQFVHVPKVLYHWRSFRNSLSNANNDKCRFAARDAIQAYLDRQSIPAKVIEQHTGNRICYDIIGNPLVSVIVLGSNYSPDSLPVDYPNVEFCSSVSEAAGAYIAFIHSDLIPDAGWLEELLMIAQQDGVGAVGGSVFRQDGRVLFRGLYFFDGKVQYAFSGAREYDPCYLGKAHCVHNVSAVDGCFCLAHREEYLQYLSSGNKNDFVSFCLFLIKKGKRVVYTPYTTARLKKGSMFSGFSIGKEYILPFPEDPYYNRDLKTLGYY